MLLLCCVWRVCSVEGTMDLEHRCVHDSHVSPTLHKLQEQRQASLLAGFGLPEEGRRRLADTATSTPVPMRIQPVFQLSGLNAATTAFITNTMVPAAVNYLSQVLSVRAPPSGPLLLQRNCLQYRIWTSGSTRTQECLQWDSGSCQIATIPATFFAQYSTCTGNAIGQCTVTPAGAGANNTDFLLMFTAQTTEACQASTLAHSSYCYQDPETDRPLAGNVNFCPSAVNAALRDRQTLIAVHEMLHALGFSDSLFPFYRDATGNPLSAVTASFTERGHTVTKVVAPTTLAMARTHFGCSTLNGAELENDGGNGTALSHWEARIFQGEAMLGVLGQEAVFSNLTLALLQDSGWYNVNFQMAEFLQSGFGLGCNFPLLSCAPTAMPAVFNTYYCNGTQRTQTGPGPSGNTITTPVAQSCTYDSLAVGFCSTCIDATCNTDGCNAITGYSNKLCTDPANANALDTSWGRAYGLDSRCFLQGDQFWVKGQQILSASGAGCFSNRCSLTAGGQFSLQVQVGTGNWVQCVDNQMVDLTSAGFSQGRLGPCPVAADFCRFATCPNSCSGFGKCYLGVCMCDPGHAGADCSQRTCSQDSQCSDTGSTCNLATKTCGAATTGAAGTPSTIITAPTGNGTAAAPLGAAVPTPTAYDPSKVGVASPGPISASVSTPPSGQLSPTDTRPQPTQGVLVISTISFGGGQISQMTNTQNRLYFESNFTADMAAAVRAAGYSGQVQVVIDGFRQGSIIVDSTTALLSARTYAEADRLVNSISSNPGAIFAADPYFQTLPAGAVNASNVRATAATTQANLNPSNGNSRIFTDGKLFNLRWFWWAAIGGGAVALCLFCCLCSSIGARKKRQQTGQLIYRQNISAETIQSLQREGMQAPYWQGVQYGPSGHGPETRRVQDYPSYPPPPVSNPPFEQPSQRGPVYPAYPPPRQY
ncbi:Leishmanolysin-like peptidase [Klebsormidium nitens]|uniref:Leishmanolysin-like peptidase n=1 Tax=Klebsormidium nitens TaxID=105231 RepID=A0A1Y1HJL7_KLENI|nr:Leishmanolysin-like peptidase [Klebsormidium nitens]|eukprot:GAQ77732.1 Leishmanolysin-like peptidase [Klebsormidium nitens]